jgi:hypothetical protein
MVVDQIKGVLVLAMGTTRDDLCVSSLGDMIAWR